MDVNLKGKRLLVLGGSIWRNAIKDFADRNGIVLISAGLYPAGTDEIAKEVYRIDTTRSDLMIPFIKEHNIDGFYMGGSEMIISAACQYINELGLPCYCTKEQWEFLQNKRNFKELCVKYGLPVAPRYQINKEDIAHSLPVEAYPVITKPEDGSGSNGFSVCHNPKELERGYSKAAANSPTESVICEKYVKNDSVVVFYTFSNGGLYFSGIEDKISVKFRKQGTYVGGLFVFESKYTNEFRELFEEKLQRLFKSIGICEGSAWIEVFHDGDNYYFNEVGFRYGGSVSVYPVDYLHGYNQVAADIYYALTGRSQIEGHSSLINGSVPRKKYYAVYPVYAWPGTIAEIKGIEEIEKHANVVLCSLTKHVGSVIPDSGSFNQNFALVHFVYDTVEECGDLLRFIHNTLKVYSDKGKDQVFKMLDFDTIEMQDALSRYEKYYSDSESIKSESLPDWFRRRMMDIRIYGGTSFRIQYEEALKTFLTDEQLADEAYKTRIGNDVIEAYMKFRTRPRDYFYFGFQNLSDELRETFLTETLEDLTLTEVTGYDKYLTDLTDKYHFYELAKPFFRRAVMLFDKQTEKDSFVSFCIKSKDLFIKPIAGSEGDGAFPVYVGDEKDAVKLFDKLASEKARWLVEERIRQSAEMSNWNASSVNTLRLPTFINANGFFVLAPIFRTGRAGKTIDNTSAGGVFAVVDEKTGVICSKGHDINGHVYDKHPDSMKKFEGYQIPEWDNLLKTARKVHELFTGHIYIAWDFALTDNGWDLIEGNWGRFRGAQLAGKKGLKRQFMEYINCTTTA
jgi:formate-dependent phosphoribosylglycinamide formyltransferase (GAR transformylase)